MSTVHTIGARALRLLDPERAHMAALRALELGLGPRCDGAQWPRLRMRLAGLDLPNAIGLAAGFDKDARAPEALLGAGFGFVECGTVTPQPQAGNPKPRLFRLNDDRAVINRMGFNNEGLDAFVARLKKHADRSGVVGANVGANKESADRIGDYVSGLARVWPHAAYVTVNISSPNTPGLRGLQQGEALEDLLSRLALARTPLTAAHGARPIFLKIAPDLDERGAQEIVEAAIAHGLNALIVSNTTIARPPMLRSARRREAGGLSGRPLFGPSTEMLRLCARIAGARLPLIGVGGVESGAGALAKIKAGASAVQLYTALSYAGPGLIARIARDLDARLMAEGFANLEAAVGVDAR